MKGVVLAGGKGTRLAPYSTVLPKPLMPIGDMPILDVVLRQLTLHGFTEITVAVGHLAELVMAYCGDGSKYGVRLTYSRESSPLGTAGPISMIPDLNDRFLVMNGDLLTTLNYTDMWAYHVRQGAIATVAVASRDVRIDLGVIETNSAGLVTKYIEKPTFQYLVSTGIYAFERRVLDHIPSGRRLDLPELVERLLNAGEEVATYRHQGYWLDIGRRDDYEEAVRKFEQNREEFFVPPASLRSHVQDI